MPDATGILSTWLAPPASDYALHQTIEAATETQARAAWRRDPAAHAHILTIASDAPIHAPSDWQHIRTQPLPTLLRQQSVTIDAWLNPTVTRNHKRRALTNQLEQLDWYARSAAPRLGLAINELRVLEERRVTTRQTRTGRRITVHAVRFQTASLIANPDAAMRAARHGIGHARAFGLGLPLITPA